jgi:hypothetical protein
LFLIRPGFEVQLNFRVYSFRLSIGLGVECRGWVSFDPKRFVDAHHGFRYKLRASIADHMYWESEARSPVIPYELGRFFRRYRAFAGYEDAEFGEVIDDTADHIIAVGLREGAYEVDADGVEGGVGLWERMEQCVFLSVAWFVPLARLAGFDILPAEVMDPGPPE